VKGTGQGWKKDAGFHHSFTTSEPKHGSGHEKSGGHEKEAPPGNAEHDKP
jgi:hypothetical protein